jgi:hypothetical protein
MEENNFRLAINNATLGKRDVPYIKRIYDTPDNYLESLMDYGCDFHNYNHTPILIHDGISKKQRTILVPKIEEQIIHHAATNVLKPIFLKGCYEHTYGAIPGRGAHNAKYAIEKWIRHDPAHCKFCIKMDIHHFYDSIPHDILMNKLAEILRDDRFLDLLYRIIEVQEHGLPLGFYTSQWLATWYLFKLDHYIKEQLGAAHYVRYADDMVIYDSNKRKCHDMMHRIMDYLWDNLGLEMKENYQVFRFDYLRNGFHRGRDLDFMGFRFYRNYTALRKSIMFRISRKAIKLGKKEFISLHDERQMLSYLGWIDCTDTYNMYLQWVKPYISFGDMKDDTSRYDRDQNEAKRIAQLDDMLATIVYGTDEEIEERENMIRQGLNGDFDVDDEYENDVEWQDDEFIVPTKPLFDMQPVVYPLFDMR